MTTLSCRLRTPVAFPAAAALLVLGFAAVALQFSSPARAATSPCSDSITSAPTGPATVSATSSSSHGKVLVVGSGAYAGCSLYMLTSDQLHSLTGAVFACSDNANALGAPCDTILWPALLTDGAPKAGPGVNPTLLGTVTRTDILSGQSVQQVTYAGQPLYRFVFDDEPGDTQGANLFDPVTSPTGTWYLLDPSRGRIAPGRAQLQLETAPVGDTGTDATVLAATMNPDFTDLFPDAAFPVYTSSADSGNRSACQAACAAVYWPPVLTDGRPTAGPGVDQNAVGTMVRPDGSHQVTYNGKPLYLFFGDAYIAGLPYGGARIDGAGLSTPWGVFNTIPPLP
jgi:predicted lipoprotein with Yx(FWY)xxD motif